MNKIINNFIKKYNISTLNDLKDIINKYKLELDPEIIYICAEIINPNKKLTAAYYTDKIICEEIVKVLPNFDNQNEIKIIEPSVGAGSFLPFIAEKYKNKKMIEITIVDIDSNELELAQLIFNTYYKRIYPNIVIKSINEDYLLYEKKDTFDLVIGNPPYFKINTKDKNYKLYKKNSGLNKTRNMFAYFINKAIQDGIFVSLIIPKSFLNAPEYFELRDKIRKLQINSILDFGEKGFKGVKIETINIIINSKNSPKKTLIKSITKNIEMNQDQKYITDKKFPSWIIYRNSMFDNFANSLQLGMFTSFRDRKITSKITKVKGKYRVLKSRNIATNKIIDIECYDKYIDNIDTLSVGKYLNKKNIVLIPNLSYYPRACFLPIDSITDGSVALLKTDIPLCEKDLTIFETKEFREYYKIARNFGTRSLNIDSNSIYYFGIRRRINND